MALINETKNTGSLTNETYTQSGLLVQDALMAVGDALGPVGAPYAISNETKNTASLTNEAIT